MPRNTSKHPHPTSVHRPRRARTGNDPSPSAATPESDAAFTLAAVRAALVSIETVATRAADIAQRLESLEGRVADLEDAVAEREEAADA